MTGQIEQRLTDLLNQDERNGLGFEDDRLFFEHNPKRNYRLRLSTPNEIAALRISGQSTELPDGCFWWTIVRQMLPGVRCRAFFPRPKPPIPAPDIPEDSLEYLFSAAMGGES